MPKKKTIPDRVRDKTKKKSKTKDIEVRTPVVTVMGHVDHGKTTLLDTIRGTNVQVKEEGGITQVVRAHVIETKAGRKITFIDTPGHEAFSGMRSRGAKITDIVLLVVAADDGVQPQTVESIKFAKKAKVPIIVAINKTDMAGSNPAKVKKELSKHDVLIEEFGGDVLVNEVSATKKKGIDELLESISLQAEVMELAGTKVKQGLGSGIVLESNMDKNLGSVALVIIKSGTISPGNYILSEDGIHKVRAVLDENQKPLERGEEAEPVWLLGLKETLDVGEQITFFESEKEAKKIRKAEVSQDQIPEEEVEEETEENENEEEEVAGVDILRELIIEEEKEEEIKKLNVIIRADSKGTLEAVKEEMGKLSDEEVEVNVISSSIGSVTVKDAQLARDSRAIILGFRVDVPADVEVFAKREKVLIRAYSVIYELIEEVSAALDSLIEPEEEEVEIARARVKKVFVLSNGQKVAGCEVIKGTVLKGYSVYVERGEERIGQGKISSLKKAKEEVREIKKGQDCGIIIDPQVDVEEGDEIVCYKIEKI